MGNKQAVFEGTDSRVDRVIEKLRLTQSEFTKIYKFFHLYDKTGEVLFILKIYKVTIENLFILIL